jgi:hypothetical protein
MIASRASPDQSDRYKTLLSQLIMPALYTFKETLVLPSAKAMHVDPKEVAGDFDDGPVSLTRIKPHHIRRSF